jgi:hypothetical protein
MLNPVSLFQKTFLNFVHRAFIQHLTHGVKRFVVGLHVAGHRGNDAGEALCMTDPMKLRVTVIEDQALHSGV